MMKLTGKAVGALKAKKTGSKIGSMFGAGKTAKPGGISAFGNKMRANKAAGVKRPTKPKAVGGARIGPGPVKSQLR